MFFYHTLQFSFTSITLWGGPAMQCVRAGNGLEGSGEGQLQSRAPDSFAV